MSQDRLQKILAHAGVASRRAAESIIKAGRVRVNGRVVSELGAKANPYVDKVELDGVRLVAETPVYLAFHKPRGVVATMSDPEGRLTVKDFMKGVTARVYPVGRLDYSTSGLILETNDGEFADGLLHPKRGVPKTYVVKVAGTMALEDLQLWSKGVELDDGPTKPAKVTLLRFEGDKTWFELTIQEGRNQQVRRMGEATGFPVMRLARSSFAGITSEGLKPGAFRSLTRDELASLKKAHGVPKSLPAPSEGAPRTKAPRGREPVPGVDFRGRARSRPGGRPHAASSSQEQPRYGGGAPGRRSYEVREDWGGGAERGRSRTEAAEDRPPGRGGARAVPGSGAGRGAGRAARDEHPEPARPLGRGGASRTTGTGGGIGARNDEHGYRRRK